MEPALRTAATALGAVTYVEEGSGPPLVLLHGVGSGSGSWAGQLPAFADRFRVVAWDAPGYGGSARVGPASPAASDYAAVLAAFLDALGIPSCHLVGHSLGAMMACAFARLHPGRVSSLVLGAPAAGYGRDGPEIQARKRAGRLDLLDALGPEGLARERHAALLSGDAPAWARERARAQMARIRPDGYRQAVELLVAGDILDDVRGIDMAATVVVGGADDVTPPDGCRAVADAFREARFELLPGLGHACYVEGPEAFNAALDRHLERHA